MRPNASIFNKVFDEESEAWKVLGVSTADELAQYMTNDLDDYSVENVIFIGKETKDGAWLILKLDMTQGMTLRAASQKNNPSITTYADAWSNRTSLTYGYLKEVL